MRVSSTANPCTLLTSGGLPASTSALHLDHASLAANFVATAARGDVRFKRKINAKTGESFAARQAMSGGPLQREPRLRRRNEIFMIAGAGNRPHGGGVEPAVADETV